ncbi:hypothetical protein VOLCADRAFT_88500 [Volvox carteri f. nagariensis]|uniref:Uncharacterized protein n=1 Tax=Volvox carteri f. nagariensis TaxID=3068 RepID=D8TP62_VOLCA|nr:uncharacterized protein VOLCADRAFT_88500 [Volvox carteri f. nagariensis]EFJ50565.1 hypothetical protein VOLCADRAFT_88500 [Volvox carteri f. nagariensis]|eukprot:XP_002948158.1 hypothetical protein VOLCADRAFT_88500 [Volvox carteri f. nagariensis]
MQVVPTVFIAFSNSLRHQNHDVPGQTSMANFLAAQRACGFPGAAAKPKALESLPLGMVLSLLGQGYKLVATGFKFGGVVAHLFAVRVLLQLHQEVQMAKQMGINLTMTLKGNKVERGYSGARRRVADRPVSSFAFGSPFFATSSLSRNLSALDLHPNQQLNLHTIWRAGDASPAFFAAASELFTVASEARDAAYDFTAADAAAVAGGSAAVGGGGDAAAAAAACDDISSPASIARTPQVAAVQEWCRHVADGVDALSRCRSTGPSRLLARQLETPLLARVCAPGGLFAPAPAAAALDAAAGDAAAIVTEKVLTVRIAEGDAGSGGGASGPKSPAATRSTSAASRSGLSRRRSQETLDTAAAATAAAGRPLSPMRSLTSRSKRAVPVVVESPSRSGPSRTLTVPPSLASRQQPGRPPAWRDALLRLLQVMGDGLGERYAPVGQFWLLGSLPSDKERQVSRDAGAASVRVLQPVEGPRAMQSSAAWLSPGNAAALFLRWESELEEIQKDLMEAFPWMSFRPAVDVRGASVDRRDLLRPSPALDLGAL